MSVEQTLAERGQRYGDFADHAAIAQAIQDAIRLTRPNGWERLNDMQRQALTVISDKIARVLSGDPNYADNWHDIQGYAKLVEDRLQVEPAFDWAGALAEQEAADNLMHDYGHTVITEEPRVPSPLREQLLDALGAMQEPAAQIDDDSDRQQAVQQNGPDGAVYDDPWYGAPGWARFKAQDQNGAWCWYKDHPVTLRDKWACRRGVKDSTWSYASDRLGAEPNPNWRDTLVERP